MGSAHRAETTQTRAAVHGHEAVEGTWRLKARAVAARGGGSLGERWLSDVIGWRGLATTHRVLRAG